MVLDFLPIVETDGRIVDDDLPEIARLYHEKSKDDPTNQDSMRDGPLRTQRTAQRGGRPKQEDQHKDSGERPAD